MFRMILSKRKKILFFFIFLGIILCSFIFYITSFTYGNSITGFTILSSKKSRTDFCENIENEFIRDICYFEKKDDGRESNVCYSIENTYLQYMCLRRGFRKHILYFTTTKFISLKHDFSNILEECKDYDEYHNLFCIYTNVASLAKDNLSEAKHICNQLEDEHLIGECKFYIASSIVMNINKDTPKKINLINGICKEINNTNWRSECYYILADELAMTKPEYLEEIANACRKSNLAIDYACFDHVTQFMSKKKGVIFCNLLENINEKSDCFQGWGQIINWSEDISVSITPCNEISIEFKSDCFRGLGIGIGSHFNNDIPSAIFTCNEIPNEFKSACFNGLGKGVGGSFDRNIFTVISATISSSIPTCNKVPPEFRNDCFSEISQIIGRHFSQDIPIAISSCNKIPPEFRNDCFRELSRGVSQHFSGDIQAAISACNKFPIKFRNDCFNNLKETNV